MPQPNLPTLNTIAQALEAWAPSATAQSYDNVGLQVGDPGRPVSHALLALDLTPAVLAEAQAAGASLIITHHPLIFRPLRSVGPVGFVPNLAFRLAEAGVALYSIHTNLDAAPGGVSFALAQQLGLTDVSFLAPLPDHPETGLGALGRLPSPEPLTAFLARVADRLGAASLRYTGTPASTVVNVAVCGGAGADFIPAALAAGADAYVTADITYHRFFEPLALDGTPRMALIDAGHYETEAITEALLQRWLSERFPAVRWQRTALRTSPMRTFVPTT